jgi:AraC-like DNA-binding protein
MAERLGVHQSSINSIRRLFGLNPRKPYARRPRTVNRERFAELWRDGWTYEDIAAELGCSPTYLKEIRVALKLPTRKQRKQRIDADRFTSMWEAGATMRDMAAVFGCSPGSIPAIRRRLGLKPRPTGRQPGGG